MTKTERRIIMEKCIYFPNESDLTFRGQEHVFPAGLGCKTMLPAGYVSDKANNLFSSMEITLMRHSTIALPRMIFGPGKRGSLSINKVSQSDVVISENEQGKIELTYTALGKPYVISQFYKTNGKLCLSLRMPNSTETEDDILNELTNALSKYNGKVVHLFSDKIPTSDCIVGYHKNKIYYATNNIINTNEQLNNEIKTFLLVISDVNTKKTSPKIITSHIRQDHHFIESPETMRMYAKFAYNVLAYIKGKEFVLQSCFDDLRSWIVYGACEEKFMRLPHISPNNTIKLLPSNAHWCMFIKNNDKYWAIVCLYGNYVQYIELANTSAILLLISDGFICDWENQKDYTLSEYIAHICKDNLDSIY